MNIFEGLKKYSSLKKGEVDFVVCSRDGKYGLLNKYLYLCLPYEYDNIELEYGQSLTKIVCRTMENPEEGFDGDYESLGY